MKSQSTLKGILTLSLGVILSCVLPNSVLSQNPTGNCPDDMLFLLRLDENSGPDYADYYGIYNGTAPTSPTAVAGQINGGQLFNANTEINIPDIGDEFDFVTGSSFSFEFWMKTALKDAQVGISRYRVDFPEVTAAWWFGINEDGYATLEIKDNWNHNSVLKSNVNLANNEWHHMVGVRDGATDINRIYVDGVKVAEMEAGLDQDFTSPYPTPITIGYMLRADEIADEYHFIGSLDEIAVFSRALTATEISTFYNQGSPKSHCSSVYIPVINSSPVTTATEDMTYTYNFSVNDQDAGDVLTLSAVNKPSWLNFTWTPGQKTAVLSGTPGNEDTGNASVTLRVNDGFTDVDQSFTIGVNAVNDLPVISGQSALTVNEDNTITLYKTDLEITDVDNTQEQLTLHVLAGTGYNFTANTITPAANFNGTLIVHVVVNDLSGQSAEYPVQITVNSVNDLPVIGSSPVLSVQANNTYLYQVAFSDADAGDILTISAASKPSWLTLAAGSNMAVLTGVPTSMGSYAVVLKVNDGHTDVLQGFAIQVSGPSAVDNALNDLVSNPYPNPATDKIYFEVSGSESIRFEIFNLTGTLQKEMEFTNESLVEIDISQLPRGIYIYKAYQNRTSGTGKFSKN